VHNFPQKFAISEWSKPVECSPCSICLTFLLQVSCFSWREWNMSPQNCICTMTDKKVGMMSAGFDNYAACLITVLCASFPGNKTSLWTFQ
jgi:hypothetical protein